MMRLIFTSCNRFVNAPRVSHDFFNVIFLATSIEILQMIQRLSGQMGTIKDETNGCDIIINQGQVFIYVYPMTNLMHKFLIYRIFLIDNAHLMYNAHPKLFRHFF
jgi:hypothetical protein